MTTKTDDSPPLGLVAGAGRLPQLLLEAGELQARRVIVGHAQNNLLPKDCKPAELPAELLVGARVEVQVLNEFAEVPGFLERLQAAGAREICFAGRVRKPSAGELAANPLVRKIIARTLKARITKLHTLNDGALFSLLAQITQAYGLTTVAPQSILPGLVAEVGTPTEARPSEDDLRDIQKGNDILRQLGNLDLGQAVVVCQGLVLGIEAAPGTDALLQQIARLSQKPTGGVLVKRTRGGQNPNIDLPSIGPETVRGVVDASLNGIAVQAERSWIIDRGETLKAADKLRLFITAQP